jgi:dCMP deaminase
MTNDSTIIDTRPNWDVTWMAMADVFAKRSLCSRFQVGVIVVSSENRVIASGYNGPPANYPTNGQCINWCPRAQGNGGVPHPLYEDCHAVHAETNALLRADFSLLNNATLYANTSVCKGCAKIVANSGIKRVVHRVGNDKYRNPEITEDFLKDCGLTVERFVD